MIRCAVALGLLGACGGASRAPHAPPTNAAPAQAVTETIDLDRDPDAPHEGALCFGGEGPTDIRAFDRVASEIFETTASVTKIGSCRIVEGPSPSGYRELTILAGTTPIARLNLCGGRALVRGISYGRGAIQIGDPAQRLTGVANLACRPDVGGYWCYGESIYDPIDRYLVEVPAVATAAGGVVVRGPAAVALIAGRTIAGASFTTRCD